MKKIITTIIFIFSFYSILSASYKEALSLYEAEKYKESLALIASELDIKKDLAIDSPNYDLRYLAAHNHWKLGNVDSALIHLKRCADIKKEIPDPFIDMSILMIEKKRYGDATFFAKKALKIAETSMTYYILGKSSDKLRNYLKAKQYFEKAISLNPDLWIAYNALGITLMQLNKLNEANTAFSAGLALMPDNTELLNNLAINLERMGKAGDAIKYIEKADEIKPEDPLIQANLNRIKKKAETIVKK